MNLCRWMVLISLVMYSATFSAGLNVVYPREGMELSTGGSDSTFIFGRVTPNTAQLSINGTSVPLYRNGTFLAYVPVSFGDFIFHCTAIADTDTLVVDRLVNFASPPESPSTDSLQIVETSLRPNVDEELLPGDLYRVSMLATPGCRAFFMIDGLTDTLEMTETPPKAGEYWGDLVFGPAEKPLIPPVKGNYTGCYQLQAGDYGYRRPVWVGIVNGVGDTLTVPLKATLSIGDTRIPRMVELTGRENVLRTARGCGYYYFLPAGVKLRITGRKGVWLRARLDANTEAWVQDYNTRPLPVGTQPPQVIVQTVRTLDMPDKCRVRVFTGERVPYRVEQDLTARTLTLYMYGVLSDTDWIRHLDDGLIRHIRWSQDAPETWRLVISLQDSRQWGYEAGYDEYDHFYLDIKKPPKIAGGWFSSPLKHRTIMLDPGHGPDLGAVGPTGYTEKDANMALALELGKQLRKKGAIVIYSRHDDEGISLRARKRMAEIVSPDVLLSLHHNAIPDGLDPAKSRGTSTYYYQPQSYELARLVQQELLETFGLNDFGLYYDNLAMCRPTQMPAILIEPAFMMHPEEEMLILSDSYRKKCAAAIVDALEDYFKAKDDD